MGASVGTGGGGRSVDVELNIVPFIDLMSCLAAFLLATAVWTNFKMVPTKPKPAGKSTKSDPDDTPQVKVCILIQEKSIWVNLTRGAGEPVQIDYKTSDHNWKKFKDVMKAHKEGQYFRESREATVAAEDAVEYMHIVHAFEELVEVGFDDISLVSPAKLCAKPTV